ncbi:MAG TPA: 3'-5' exonuclease [Kiritimatiellia bacterium]|nr:3'-5' exonuclease [Kiritimatiellia bacterium]
MNPKSRLAFLLLLSLLAGTLRADSPPIHQTTLVFFDVETTGLSPYQDRIVEIGAVRYEHGKVTASQSWLVNPERRIPYSAVLVHGIRTRDVRDQPTFAEIYPEIRAFFRDNILVAHNARFDLAFLREEILRAGYDLPENPVLDSLRLFRSWYPDQPSHSIEPLMASLGIEGEGYHRAEADAMFIVHLLERALQDRAPRVPTLAETIHDAGGLLLFQDR